MSLYFEFNPGWIWVWAVTYLWIAYFGGGLLGYQLVKKIEEVVK